MPASGHQDHTTSPSASSAIRQERIHVHRIPPRVHDDREPPLWGTGPNRNIPVSTRPSSIISEFQKFIGVGVSTELFAAGTSAARWTDYLSVGNAKVGMRITNIAAATISTRYFHTDHLGSIAVITDENGVVVERLSYDAWGKRRFASGADDPTGSITSQSPRGFTGEEQLDTVALVHLNGRVYDPMVGRMISADPTVPDPLNAQAWNRYSYVGNDPLAFTDPSGFSWLSGFFHSVGHSLGRVISSIGHFISQNWRSIAQIAINFALNAVGLNFVAAAALSAAIVNGLSGGNLGQVLRAGAIAGATTLAFAGLNIVAPAQAFGANFDPVAYAENVGGSALVGCASSAASGGSCGSGAAAGAVSAGLSPVTRGLFPNAANDLGQRIGGTIVQATAGGLASIAGGGKFANGAVTGAFGYLVALGVEKNPLASGNWRDANAQALPPVFALEDPIIIAPRGLTPLEELPAGSAGGPGAGKAFPRSLNDQQPDDVPCTYCGEPTSREAGPDQLNGDHVIPRSQGGNNSPENYVPSCRSCNLEKGPRTPEQWYNWIQRGGA